MKDYSRIKCFTTAILASVVIPIQTIKIKIPPKVVKAFETNFPNEMPHWSEQIHTFTATIKTPSKNVLVIFDKYGNIQGQLALE